MWQTQPTHWLPGSSRFFSRNHRKLTSPFFISRHVWTNTVIPHGPCWDMVYGHPTMMHPKRSLCWQNMTHHCTKNMPKSWDNSMCILPWQWFSNQRPLLLHVLVVPVPSCNNWPTKMTETKGFDAWTCIGIKCSNDFERFWVLPIVPSKLNAQQTLVIP